jgi:hypothetical protein
MVLVGAQIGSRVSHRLGVVSVIRVGMVAAVAAFVYIAFVIGPDVTFLRLLPGMMAYGIGFGLSVAQLTNVVLSDVAPEKSGAAGGANNTARQVGFAIGIAVIGTLLSSRTITVAVERVQGSVALPADVKASAVQAIHAGGVAFRPPSNASPAQVVLLERLFVDSLAVAVRTPLLFAGAAVFAAFLLTALLPTPGERPLDPAAADLAGEELGV